MRRKLILAALLWTILGYRPIYASLRALKADNHLNYTPVLQDELIIKGKVQDENGKPMSGVTVSSSTLKTSTLSQKDGTFELKSKKEDLLKFSYIGYDLIEKKVLDATPLNITMKANTSQLKDVVVVGYGTQKKENITGSVASISATKIQNRPVTSMQNALQGIAPGVTVLQRTGDVGTNASITVRGRSNLGAPGPMIIIDGIPASSVEFAALSGNDIANMSILKDASSASIYGSRAANGVILVTTRRGQLGTPSVEINTTIGVQSLTRKPSYVDSKHFALYKNESLINAGKSPTYTEDQIKKFSDHSAPDLYPNTNWYDLTLVKNPILSNTNINISGGTKATKVYFGATYENQQSLVPNKSLEDYTIKLNTETQISESLKFGTNIGFIRSNYELNGGALNFVELNRANPTFVGLQSDGSFGTVNTGVEDPVYAKSNLLRVMKDGGRNWDKNHNIQMSGNMTYSPVKGLNIQGLMSLKYDNRNSFVFVNRLDPLIGFISKKPIASTAVSINSMEEKWNKRQEFLAQMFADYEKTIGKHYAKIMVGASQESNIYRQIGVGRRNFPINDLNTVITGSSNPEDVLDKANSSQEDQWAMRSVFSRFNYSYDEKYLLEVNFRIDKSSRFDPRYRSAMFPAISAGWIISKENFMQNIKWINSLKIRGSWGLLGNQDAVPIGNYYNVYNTNYAYSFDGNPYGGVWQENGVYPQATWEKVKMSNIGIDAVLLNNKLSVTAEYYEKATKDILLQINQPATYGLNAPFQNAGSTRNRGIELSINYSDKIGDDFKYSIGGNLSSISNKITDLGPNDKRINGVYIEKVGESVGSFYGYKAIGLFKDAQDVANSPKLSPSTKPGDIKYADLNKDGIIDSKDRMVLGNDVPWLNYGFNLDLSYKNFDLSVLTYAVAGVQTYLTAEDALPFFNGGSIKTAYDNRWSATNQNPNAHFPRLLPTAEFQSAGNDVTSSFWLFNTSFFRVRSITLGYNLNQDLVKKLKLQRVRFFVTSNNPFTFTFDKRMNDFDPEQASTRGGFPGIKVWSAGLNVKF